MHNFKNERLLVIAPHADDEVLGCGGLISRVKHDGGKVYVLIFNIGSIVKTDNDKFTQKWKKEANEAMRLLKVDKYETVYETPEDNRYLDAKPLHALISKIETDSSVSLTKIEPIHSHHQDHVHVFKACIAALRPINKPFSNVVISYEAPEHSRWSSSGVFEPNFYVNIEDHLNNKITAFYKYKSQVKLGGRDKNTIKNQAHYRGREVGQVACEAFYMHRFVI